MFYVASNAEDYETPNEDESELRSSATQAGLALSTRTVEKTRANLASAAKTDEAGTYTVHTPKVSEIPIRKDVGRVAQKVLEYVVHET